MVIGTTVKNVSENHVPVVMPPVTLQCPLSVACHPHRSTHPSADNLYVPVSVPVPVPSPPTSHLLGPCSLREEMWDTSTRVFGPSGVRQLEWTTKNCMNSCPFGLRLARTLKLPIPPVQTEDTARSAPVR